MNKIPAPEFCPKCGAQRHMEFTAEEWAEMENVFSCDICGAFARPVPPQFAGKIKIAPRYDGLTEKMIKIAIRYGFEFGVMVRDEIDALIIRPSAALFRGQANYSYYGMQAFFVENGLNVDAPEYAEFFRQFKVALDAAFETFLALSAQGQKAFDLYWNL